MKKKTILSKLNEETFKGRQMAGRIMGLKEVTNSGKRASFYGKAHAGKITVGDTTYEVLKSYDTYTAIRNYRDGSVFFTEHTNTTTRHLRGFLGTTATLKELRLMNDKG